VNWNLDAHFKGVNLSKLITTDDVKRAALGLKIFHDPVSSEQESYLTSIVSFMTYFDEKMFSGEWELFATTIEDPFIMSDAPVVTWDRTNSGLSFGVGFERPNVEVLLPVSPLTCLHILPKVPRTRQVVGPRVEEVNIAQAKFAHRSCFANQNNSEIDNIVQRHISTAKLGENAFSLSNKNYNNIVFDILMRQGLSTRHH